MSERPGSEVPSLEVRQGGNPVEHVDILLSGPDMLVLEIGVGGKHPVVSVASAPWGSAGPESTGSVIWIYTSGSELEQPSQVILPASCTGWQVIVDPGRYTVFAAAWRRGGREDRVSAWVRDRD